MTRSFRSLRPDAPQPSGAPLRRVSSLAANVEMKRTTDWLAGRDVVHYAIDALAETGTPRSQDGSEIGSDKLQVEPGDLLISRLNPRKSHVFSVTEHNKPIVASTEFAVMRPRQSLVDQRFLKYLFLSESTRQHLDSHVRSATKSHGRVEFEFIWGLTVPVPRLEEQRRIADMLDHEAARIDTLIAKNVELRELIEERRTRQVAELLDLDAPVRPLRYCLRQFIGGDWGSDEGDEAVDINVYRAADFDRHRHLLDPRRAPTRSISTTSLRSRELEVGDIIIEKSGGGEKQPVGCCVIVRSVAEGRPRIPSNFNARLVVSSDLEPEFLNAVLAGLYRSGRTVPYIKQTTGIQNLDLNAFLDVKVPVPDRVRQARLARTVINDWSELDELDSRILHQQSLLSQRREALITAAVTGAIDV